MALLFSLSLSAQDITIGGSVFGGGHNGKVEGATNVTITDGEIGQDKWIDTSNGGVFGAGEGKSATVTGSSSVKVSGGVIRNDVYGGGKQGELEGNATVEITGGTIHCNVYAGARLADVDGYAYAYIHGTAVLGGVFGGNDMAGVVHNNLASNGRKYPDFYSDVITALGSKAPTTVPTSFVRIARDDDSTQPFVGAVYGGGDGGYTYVPNAGRLDITLPNDCTDPSAGNTTFNVAIRPTLDRSFVDFSGGTVGNLFAGGESVTVTDAADVYLHADQTKTPTSIPLSYIKGTSVAGTDKFISAFDADAESYTVSGDNAQFTYQINRVFGGNNRADMSIRPSWHLTSAHVNNLYSGGNRGDMTYANGICIAVEGAGMTVHKVFGGCRLSDVHPSAGSITAETIEGFDFPAGYAARVLIKGGKIYNVFGGNDISGQVYHGANVVIRSSIIENVYGSGNGAYAYVSDSNDDESDFFYQTNGKTGTEALDELNQHRPNTENVLIDIAGTSTSTTFVAGQLFCGGNNATLCDLTGSLEFARAKLKIGSYVALNEVFLGSNGEHMFDDDIIIGMNDNTSNPNITLTDHDQMVEYVKGVEVAIKPTVEFASDYVKYSAQIGSFYCGGNKGSMTAAGTFTIDFLQTVKILDKLVAGCKDANVAYKDDNLKDDGTTDALVNHSYALGGLTSEAHPKVLLNISGLQLEPRKITFDAEAGTFDIAWNHYQGDETTEGDMADWVGYLHGGNIYGGCYNSGYVNGDVQINISEKAISDDCLTYFDEGSVTIGTKTYKYGWDDHRYEAFVSTLSCYGGGYGEETEIWGSTRVDITNDAYILKVRGGGEMGWVGKMKRNATTGVIEDASEKFDSYYWSDSTQTYKVNIKAVEQAYDATVRLNANYTYYDTKNPTMITNNVAEICAGGFEGIVTGNTHAIIDQGCVYTVFGGASNAHIYGNTEVLIGENGFPYITKTVYGGNDFGGLIMGDAVYATKNTAAGSIQKVKCNTYVEYFAGEVGYNTGEHVKTDSVTAVFGLFGGSYGEYDYCTTTGNRYYGKAKSQPNILNKITINKDANGEAEADFAANCFVNISSKSTEDKDKVRRIYGGGQGLAGQNGVANTRQTYVLVNAANANVRSNYLAQYIFGAGDCATTWYSRLDAYSGNAHHLFGACRGVSYVQTTANAAQAYRGANPAQSQRGSGATPVQATTGTEIGTIQSLSYMGELSIMNVYPTMIAPQMEVFASGAFSGTKRTYLNLYGGHVAEVYGASVEEGITYLTEVNVPAGSTIHCNAIYGGGKGLYVDRPCDTYISTINYHSSDAIVDEAIYGGNRDYRFTRRSMVSIKVPVKNSLGELVNVYGGGKGENTISEMTYVSLDDGAQVKNVFGGSCDGKVYSKPAVIQYMLTKDYYKDKYLIGSDDGNGGTRDGSNSYCLGDCEIGGFNTWKQQEGIKTTVLFEGSGYDLTIGTLVDTRMDYAEEQYDYNTDVQIREGAIVTGNAYGGGEGEHACTSGVAAIHLKGGTVMGNIYGGGYGGSVKDELDIAGTTLTDGSNNQVTSAIIMHPDTKVYLEGGTCTSSFGGGLNGDVIGSTYTEVGIDVCGTNEGIDFYSGDPAITRSLYGGGQNGAVLTDADITYSGSGMKFPFPIIETSGTACIEMKNGHVGYTYDASLTDDASTDEDERYVTNVDYQTATDSILYNNGNVFGGGYGEEAKTIYTRVYLYDGLIRNSLYGGGEIASIGLGTIDKTTTPQTATITQGGETHIYMYGGHVLRDVFGGGRGYSFSLQGDEVIGTKYYTDGYVFGSTDVNIYRGEIGTGDQESLDLGYGNVFGGGNVGYVYSATGTKQATTEGGKTAGYYYKTGTTTLSDDCNVLISPYAKVTDKNGVTVNGTTYAQCAYVPTDELNYLLGKSSADADTWEKMDYLTGVTVHNAVFAGGNVTQGDSKLYADATTVFGNASATLNDIYHRDLITIGTENTGGIYGDGNLTKVDGFREICVVNYGTDYYNLESEIDIDTYNALNDRERAYFQLQYKCTTAYGKYALNQKISEDTYLKMDATERANWTHAGFCSIYAGRLLNTIQRADFVGIHGSRIVLQGAQDRTVSVVDYMEYAVNRVGEISLNQKTSVASGDTGTSEATHGNYLGFYNTVNFLAALTSDVDFQSVRTTDNTAHQSDGGTTYGTTTYYDYKAANIDETWRNNGSSANKVALNNGVFLEIVDHLAAAGETEGTGTNTITYNEGDKVYGPITGVVELDLMNLGENIGGAFVYAKNIHGTRSGTMATNVNISPYNASSVTYQGYTYTEDATNITLETSGNFINSTKPIVDDCYPGSASLASPGHYWFLRGEIYLYDQYISAYTGASTAYLADVQIPLTITAGTHGRLKILNIQPNLYAYYAYDVDGSGNKTSTMHKLDTDEGVVVNGTTYHLNDVVTYWDWSQMTETEQELFVYDTYIAVQAFSYTGSGGGTVSVAKGTVMTSDDYAALPATVTVTTDGVAETVAKSQPVHISNATSHDNGYVLTADISNPVEWADRYINNDKTDANFGTIITKTQYDALSDAEKDKYIVGPTYSTPAGIYGQTEIAVGDYISNEIVGAYTKMTTTKPANQATVEMAYITTGAIEYTYGGVKKVVSAGTGMSATEYAAAINATTGNPDNANSLQRAYVCSEAIELNGEYFIPGELISTTKYEELQNAGKGTKFSEAWVCTVAGLYGGVEYTGNNQDALKGWSDLTQADRSNGFTFNYDALDLFINNLDPNAKVTDYDKDAVNNPYYSKSIYLDYSAVATKDVSYTIGSPATSVSITTGQVLKRTEYEAVPNEQINYAYIKAKASGVYVVNEDFMEGDVPYSVGDVIEESVYTSLATTNQPMVTKLTFTSEQNDQSFYYCKQAYTPQTVNGAIANVTDIYSSNNYSSSEVPVGTVISETDYDALPNLQSNFRITGTSPVETSTLYVARDASIEDLQKDRVVTVIYEYQYDESTEEAMETVTERHIVNIHLMFRSGSPSIGRLRVPGAVIPGTSVGLKQPTVNAGAYEILGGGWEIYDNETDANMHVNGSPYVNNQSVLYFYQTGKYVNYYAKTYLGKTYSNAVPLDVANYHSINDVMADTEHHMYIDHEKVPRNPKIYIDNDVSQSDATKSELDLLKDLYDLSIGQTITGETHAALNEQVKGCQNLDFILQDDVAPKKYTDWTPLGTSTQCFGDNGFFHGDGHYIYGLNNALFGNYCGMIFNTGVKGTFNASGFTGAALATRAEYAANCWVWNENEATHTGRPIIGNEGADSDAGTLDNCYYWEEAGATTQYTAGTAIRKDETAFSNGEVAYDLNKYYLLKRYNDKSGQQPTTNPYSYWDYNINAADQSLTLHAATASGASGYDDADAFLTYTDDDNVSTKHNYVEYRYRDGDFVNADGKIHVEADERYSNGEYYPIYPDDYFFFGQSLNYGYTGTMVHDMFPKAIAKTDEQRLVLDNSSSNRVYRAPAYFGTMEKQVAHFNVDCVLPQQYLKQISSTTTVVTKDPQTDGFTITMSGTSIDTKTETLADGTIETTVTTTVDNLQTQLRTITTVVTTSKPTDVYPHMTAIDYTGYSDLDYKTGITAAVTGTNKEVFYAPILDYRTLIGFNNPDQTRNMLVYNNSTADSQGYEVLSNFLYEPPLTVTDDVYRNIPLVTDAVNSLVQGHLIDKVSGDYVTDRHHYLVDQNDYHCPIAFQMGTDKRMWYQRTPCCFAEGGSSGYESIILPFTAELVSAHQKGEITHFYNNDRNNHEYWLRGFQGVTKTGAGTQADPYVYTLKFIRPMDSGDGYDSRYETTATYTVANDFLNEYYYSNSSRQDDNQDKYQTYYSQSRTYTNYLPLTANVPYLMAFPGKYHYEFDMSGQFVPQNTFAAIDKLDKQNISFCSAKGASIPTSPEKMESTHNGYTYHGLFQKEDISALTATEQAKIRIININGDKFDTRANIYTDQNDPTLTYMWPFHAYMITTSNGDPSQAPAYRISEDATYLDEEPEIPDHYGELCVTARDRVVRIESFLEDEVTAVLTDASGRILAKRTLAPGEVAKVPVDGPGIYMVNSQKVLVK